MLMKNECSAVSSVKIKLTFDDSTVKERLVSHDDLVDVVYNANGLRKEIIGRVVKISTVGSDPKGWYLIIDGSDDFDSAKARFSPISILDIDILRKADSLDHIQTPLDDTGIPYLRIKDGYLEYSRDGVNWHFPKNGKRPHIEPAVDPRDYDERPHHHHIIDDDDDDDYSSDGIEDAEY